VVVRAEAINIAVKSLDLLDANGPLTLPLDREQACAIFKSYTTASAGRSPLQTIRGYQRRAKSLERHQPRWPTMPTDDTSCSSTNAATRLPNGQFRFTSQANRTKLHHPSPRIW